jgi:hypothetical protein
MQHRTFARLVASITARVQGRAADGAVERHLNQGMPAGGAERKSILSACEQAIAAGCMCDPAGGGINFGRVVKPGREAHGFGVDVVTMKSLAGPHHRQPNSEIDLIMPLSPGAKLDGRGAGWLVHPAGSGHFSPVSDGNALVLYLLPAGAIEFAGG